MVLRRCCTGTITHDVAQLSVLGLLLLINDLKNFIYEVVYYFADDRNLLYTSYVSEENTTWITIYYYFLKRKNEHINHDLVSSKKTFLHARKTQIIIVEFEFKTITKNLFFGASGQRVGILQCTILLHISKEFGNMGNHYTNITPKLKKAVRPLSKIRHSAPKLLIKIIYYSRSKSQLIYADQIWGWSKTHLFKDLENLQDKALRIISCPAMALMPIKLTVSSKF